MPRISRSLVGAAVAVGALALTAGVASAHVDADPLAIQKGTTATVSFGVEHGCETSPTVKVEMRFPDGYTGLKPVALGGWTSTVAGNVVAFTGGSLPATTPGGFAVDVTAPATAGTTYVPVVQTCEKGSLSWIQIPEEGKAEPELPAAMIKVTEGVPTADDLKAAPEATTTGDDDSSSKTAVVVGVVAALLVAGAAVVLVRGRRRPAPPAA